MGKHKKSLHCCDHTVEECAKRKDTKLCNMPLEWTDYALEPDMHTCCSCGAKFDYLSPWSVCYDPEYKRNVWGGDTHLMRGYLCQACAKKLLHQ